MTPAVRDEAGGEGLAARRRRTAIAFADIVGYTALMAADEAGTYARWMAMLREVVRPEAELHQGRVVDLAGDGVLAEFPTAAEALGWARAVLRALPALQAP